MWQDVCFTLVAHLPNGHADNRHSFCRKTTLTKHFKRYHPIKAEDSCMSNVDGEDDDGCGDSDEDDSCSESEISPAETQLTRHSSYYGDHWPLPCETAQNPNPTAIQAQLALRPKSTVSRVKHERPRSVSPQLIRSVPPANGPTSSYHYPRGRTMSIQTQMEQDFSQIPMPSPYPQEQSVNDTSSPCQQFPTDNSMSSLTSPTTIQSSPTGYSDISSAPEGVHTTLFFAGPTSQPYASQDDPSAMGFPPPVPIEDTIQDLGQQPRYDMESKSMIQMQLMYEDNAMGPQQPLVQPIMDYHGAAYQVPAQQYHYGPPPPTWYRNAKDEESWYVMPSERLRGFSDWNH
ncbi:MAG: hypothetical protein L6R39_006224 [Caloplaca ligustica]|nr:MAG: hypothetical protein L6R39_006224 [Caloplaca ligustica]